MDKNIKKMLRITVIVLVILQFLSIIGGKTDKNSANSGFDEKNSVYSQAVAVSTAGDYNDEYNMNETANFEQNEINSYKNEKEDTVNALKSGALNSTADAMAVCVSMLTGIRLTETSDDFAVKVLTACLPWDFSSEKTGDIEQLVFNYAAGDESSYFWKQNEISDKPQVAIYSTHSAESYVPYSGQASVSGERGGVYVASSVVAEILAKKNIGTLVDDTIHDSPNWNLSYKNSLETARRILNEYPSVQILIDMHRDAGVPKDKTTVEINGKKAACIMLVVGSNQRYEHPYWQENLAFAESIGNKMEEMYPGLLRTVKVQNGRYNQHISTHSILVEMGATDNTIEEVEYSATMLANVLAEVLNNLN